MTLLASSPQRAGTPLLSSIARPIDRKRTSLARRPTMARLVVEVLEQRIVLSETLNAEAVTEIWNQVADGNHSFFPSLLEPALSQHQNSFQTVDSNVRSRIEQVIGPITAPTSTKVTFGITIKAELDLGPSFFLAGIGLEIAEIAAGYNLSYSLTDENWTLSRDFGITLLGAHVESSFSATVKELEDFRLTSVQDCSDPAFINSPKNDAIDFQLSVAGGAGVEVDAKVGEILMGGVEFSGGRDYTLQFATQLKKLDFLCNYARQLTLADGLADVFIPYVGDPWWQDLLLTAGSFTPILKGLGLVDLALKDTPLGILSNSPSVQVSVQDGLEVNAVLWGAIGGSLDAGIGRVEGGLRVEVGLSGGKSATIFGPVEIPSWFPRGATLSGQPRLLSVDEIAAQFRALDVQPTGVTVVTHGFQPPVLSDGDSLYPLARAIHDRAGGWLLDYEVPAAGSLGGFDNEVIDPTDPEPIQSSILPNATDMGHSGEVVLLFDWANESNELSGGWGEAAGDALFSTLVGLGLVDPEAGADNIPLHFIAHSFGSTVTSEVIERLARYSVPVDHVTYLDPHDFVQQTTPAGVPDPVGTVDGQQRLFELGEPAGYGAAIWDNVRFADVYYETRGLNGVPLDGDAPVPRGRPIPGAYNFLLTPDQLLPASYPLTDISGDHTYIWKCFYMATVTGRFPDPDACPSATLDFSKGYTFSRIAHGESGRPAPEFFGPNQDHTFSSHTTPPFVDARTGRTFTAAEVTQGRWEPEWNPFTIVNGDFANPNPFSNNEPGWSHHGGGGGGTVEGTGNHFLQLDAGTDFNSLIRTHNLLYVPPDDGDDLSLAFDLQLNLGSPDDTLLVFLGHSLLAEIQLMDDDLHHKAIPIPPSLRGTVQTVTFELRPSGFVDSPVLIDNVQFFAPFAGRTGDVVPVDLGNLGTSFELIGFVKGSIQNSEVVVTQLVYDQEPDGDDILLRDGASGPVVAKVVLSDRVDNEPFAAAGRFYFVPDADSAVIDADTTTAGFQGVVVAVVRIDGVAKPVPIQISAGYSHRGQKVVRPGSDTLDVLRVQQRLNDLGFPDSDGNPLVVDGLIGPRTQHVIGLFNAAVNALSHDHTPSSAIDLLWINDRNAPRWVELAAAPGLEIVGGQNQSERWATSWANDLVGAAAAAWQQNSVVPHPDLAMIGASLKQGGDTPFHISHEAGMDVDFDTPSTNDLFDESGNLRVPFFAVVERPGSNEFYVAAKAGGVLVQNAAGDYEAADPNAAGFDWSVALNAVDAWDNQTVLDKLRDPSLMASAPGYDLDSVRGQIAAFSGFVRTPTDSGVRVENILYNDPRTWDLDGVTFFAGHSGHFHVNVAVSLIPAGQQESLVEGLRELQTSAESLSDAAILSQEIPGIGMTTADALATSDTIGQELVDPVETYFEADATPTREELDEALETKNGGTAESHDDANELTHDIEFEKTRMIGRIPIDLGTLVQDLGLKLDFSATVDLSVTVSVALTVGLDQTPGLARDEQFFVEINRLTASLNVHSSDLSFDGHVGFLGVGVEGGTFDLDLDLGLEFNQARLTLAELRSMPLSSLVTVTAPTASLDVMLPVVLGRGTPCANPMITIHDDDLFSGPGAEFSATGFADLLNFRNITPDAALQMLNEFNHWLGQFRDSSLFQVEIPFTNDRTLGDAFDLEQAFVQKLTTPLRGLYGNPNFQNADQLGDRLGRSLGLGESDIDQQYDCSTHDLTYHVRLAHDFNPQTVPIDLSVHAGTFADASTSATLQLDAGIEADFKFGVDLSSPITDLSLSRDFFITDATLTGTVTATASDIDAAATLGPLGVHVTGGTASATGMISLDLQDPGTQTNDGRITLGELVGGLGDPATLVMDLDTDGTGSFSLPVAADPFMLGGVTVALSGLVSGTDEQIDFTLTAAIAGTIVSGLVIEPLPSGGPSTVTFTKGEGLDIHARARILGVAANLDGDIAADSDFSFVVETDEFDIGGAMVRARGNIFRIDDLIGWNFVGSVRDWMPLPFLTVETLDVTIDPTMIGFETTTTIAGIAGIHLAGDFQFADKSYAITADAATDWEPINGVRLTQVIFSISNRNPGAVTRVTARADLELLDTQFIVSANVTGDGDFWIAAQPTGSFEPIPGLEIHDTLIVANTYELVLDVGTVPVTEVTDPPAQLTGSQRRVPVGVNLVAAATLPENIPVVGGSEVQIAGHIGTSLAELSIEAKLVLAHPPEIAGLFAFDAVGLRITGAPSLSVFGQGRVLHDRIPSLEQDVGVEAALTLDIVNTTLSGSLSLLQPADGSPPIPNLFGIDGLNILEGEGEFGINFATTPLPLPTIGFNLVAEMPDFAVDTLSLPRTIGAALNISTTEPIFAVSVLDWRPFHVLGIDDIVIDEGSIVAAPNGGSIATKVFPRGFSAAFEADILGTHVSYLGVFNEQTQGIIMNGSVSTTRIAGVTVGGPGCDGVVQDGVDNGTPDNPDPDADNGACFAAAYTATNPLENGLTVDFTIDLPGPGGLLDVHGELGNTFFVLDATVDDWQPIAGLDFDGSLHAEVVLKTISLALDFELDATILGAATHFEGTLSASPSGFAIFVTGTLPLGPAGGPRLVNLAATIDIGVNSPFFVELAADFTLPGSRPAEVHLEGGIGSDGVEIFADIQNWEVVPGLAFDGSVCIDVGAQSETCEAPGAVAASVSDGSRDLIGDLGRRLIDPPTSSNLVFRIDVSARLLGSRLNLVGTYVAGPNGPEMDLTGDVHFGGKRLGMASVDLTAELHVNSGADPFELGFHGKLKLIDDLAAIDVVAEVSATDSGGFAMSIDASVNYHPTLSLGGFSVRLDVTLGAEIGFGVNPTFASASLELSGRACVTVPNLGEKCTGSVGLSIRFDTGSFVIKNVKPQVTTNRFGIPTGVKWKDITRAAADASEPRVTVTAECSSVILSRCDTIKVTGTAAPEFVRAFQSGINIVVQTQNSVGEWVTLLQRPTSRVTTFDADLKGGNDSIDLSAFGQSLGIAVPAVLRGGAGRDVIRGGAGPNTIYGGTGVGVAADVGGPRGVAGRIPPFLGGGGIIFPGPIAGLLAADGDDQLFGGNAADAIFGEAGNDSITSGLGADALDGGSGVNLIDGRLEVRGTDRPERIEVFRDIQTETACIDLPFGGGQQCFTIPTVDDIVVQSASGASPAITLGRTATAGVTSLDVDSRGGNDLIEVNSNIAVPAVLRGGAGHDAIQGGGGTDSVFGDAGIDLLIGGAGDLLDGGTGSTIKLVAGLLDVVGTADPERFELAKALLFFPCGPAGIISFPPCQDAVRVRAINAANGETATFLVPLATVSTLRASLGDGDDTIIVTAALATPASFDLGPGGDFAQAGSGPTTVHGGDGDDQLMGGPGNDAIFGEADDDTITCGGGGDELDGGPGTNDVSCGDNHPPMIDPIGDYTINEGSTLTLGVMATDPDTVPTDEPPLPTFIGPIPYLSRADSPFDDFDFSYFHLEDFEDGELNVPGVTASAGSVFSLENQPPNGRPAGIVSWWRAEGNATDSADDNDGTLQNGATFAAGQADQAFSFDGVDDEVVVPHNANQNTGDQITIDAWINPTSSGHGRPIAQKRSPSNVGGYTFETTHSPFGPDNGLQFGIWIAGTLHVLQTPANVVTVGAWQHVAATFDGAMMRIFVNGVEQASTSVSGTIDVATDPLVIGRNVVIPSFAWQGFIDELGIFNRALSASTILSVYESGLTPANSMLYQTDFENGVVDEWGDFPVGSTPIGGRTFLGQFTGNRTVSLRLGTDTPILTNGLPAHTELSVAFDLFVIRTWDGNSPGGGSGPDIWDLTVRGGPTLLHTTFNNGFPGIEGFGQAYPDAFPGGSHPIHTGAAEINTLGFEFPGVGVMDAVYHLSFTFPHTASSLVLDFTGMLTTNNDADEGWGLDNVVVSLGAAAESEPVTYSVGGDFSRTTNPGGPWSYGWTPIRSGEFHLYPHHYLGTGGGDVWDEPAIVSLGAPSVFFNGTGSAISSLGRQFLPGKVVFHPGPNGENCVIRWTAPATGQIDISAAFSGYDTATTDVAVLHNTGGLAPNELFSGDINGEGDRESFMTTIDVMAGDSIDFTVGHGGNGFFFDSTLIDAAIRLTTSVTPPGGNANTPDSVDADDGTIDGDGSTGHSFMHDSAAEGITFTFDPETLGELPTHVGIVWTDGGMAADVEFEAFDADGVSVGVLRGDELGDATNDGTTGEDRFFGVEFAGGISAIAIRDLGGGFIEVDHLQFGRSATGTTSQSFSAAADFSATQNPNGPWTYGFAIDSGPFQPFSTVDLRGGFGIASWYDPSSTNFQTPSVTFNDSSSSTGTECGDILRGQLALQPGGPGQPSIVRWTAPQTGRIQIVAQFIAVDCDATDVSVLHVAPDSQSFTILFEGSTEGSGGSTGFTGFADIAAGDTIDFVVETVTGFFVDGTALDAEITLISSAPPAPSEPPTQVLTYSLDPGAPTGAMIDPQTGVFTWTPSEPQGPGDFSITVRVRDDGSPSLSASRTFAVSVNEVNEPPVLANIFNQTVSQSQTLRFTAHATDPDRPANRLDFSLDPGAPIGAAIDAQSGEFTWTASADIHATGDYEITVRVTDRGSPAFSDSQTVTITVVADVTPPTIDRVTLNSNARFITEIVLSANELLDPTEAAATTNYRLVTPGFDGRFGTRDDISAAPRSAVYDAAIATVTLTPAVRLSLNQLFEIIVTSRTNPDAAGITDLAGNPLDGDRNETASGNYVAFLARSDDRLAYPDRTGDTVSLIITRGIMDLLLDADGEAIHLSLHDGPGASTLTSRVRTRNNDPSTTTIRLVTGTNGLQVSLPPAAFQVQRLSAAAVDDLLASGDLSELTRP